MGKAHKMSLPLIPLPRDAILLPGLVQRISVTSSRPDVAALLAHVYERAASKGPDGRIDSVPIACVPVTSPFVGPNGQLLISNGEEVDTSAIEEVNPGAAKKDDLYHFGVAAKIIGIEGRGAGEFALRVEGTSRIRIDGITRERPYFEGQVTYFTDDSGFRLVPVCASVCLRLANTSLYQLILPTNNSKIFLHSSKHSPAS